MKHCIGSISLSTYQKFGMIRSITFSPQAKARSRRTDYDEPTRRRLKLSVVQQKVPVNSMLFMWTKSNNMTSLISLLVVTYLAHHRLILGLHRNSAKSAMWSDDHSGEGRAVSFLKLSSSRSSNNDSTVNESAERREPTWPSSNSTTTMSAIKSATI